MKHITLKKIENEIKIRTNTYRLDPPILLSGYNQEKQTVEDYEGRQLLELMQNADDAKSEIICIDFETNKSQLVISNNGDSFSFEGIQSLMYTGNSTKNKEEYIGNKGLGFRSILNWSHLVSIHTKEVSFQFSEEYSKKYFKQHIANSQVVKEAIENEITQGKLKSGEVPIATLAFPEVIPNNPKQDYVTQITLDVKETYVQAVLSQINQINEELLLFLPHVKSIRVTIDGKIVKSLIKSLDNNHQIIINDTQWYIYRSEKKIYQGEDLKIHKYKFAIAWKEDLSIQNGRFYTYFPTDVETNLPCIIHATFDLNNSRKEINATEANKQILQDIVASFGEITEQLIKKYPANWNAYTFLTVTNKLNKRVLADFYIRLNQLKEDIGVYPTVDNSYVLKEDALYHGEQFSTWVQENGLGNYFPNLLVAKHFNLPYIKYCFSAEGIKQIIKNINPLLSIEQRVQLIGIFAKNEEEYFNILHQSSALLPLLLNNKGEIIPENIRVFTKNTEGDNLKFPEYIQNIEFISVELYECIKSVFSEEIEAKKLEKESGDTRAIKRFLDPVVNIGLDDITGVIQHVISETNRVLKTEELKTEIVKAMVQSLYSIFISNPERRGNLSTINNIPLIAKDGSIQDSDDLYFGDGYSIGVAPALIFEGIRKDEEYLAPNLNYDLEGNENDSINFFKWLNVNTLSKSYIQPEKHLVLKDHNDYTDYVINSQENSNRHCNKYYEIKSFEGLDEILVSTNFNIERLIAWVVLDSNLRIQLTTEHTDKFRISYNGAITHFTNFSSYAQFLIQQSKITDNVVANLQLQNIEKLNTINFDCELFKKLAFNSEDILQAIRLLQIKTSLNDLSPQFIYNLIKDFPITSDGNNSQIFYKLMYDYLRENEETQLKDYKLNFDELKYFARKGGLGKDLQLIPYNEVYYSDNKLLPQSILNNFWFINLPKRIGENRVQNFFGVKLIKNILNIIEIEQQVEHILNRELNSYLNKLKPYLLAYRLKSLVKVDDKKDAANSIKKVQFNLVSKASYSTSGSDPIILNDYDFIPKDDLYTIQFSKNTNVDLLQKNSNFCDTIAEIFCVVFKVGDLKNTFRRIFKDGLSESKHILQADEDEHFLVDAYQLLGVSKVELNFWKHIFPKEQLELNSDEELRSALKNKIGIELPEAYKYINFEDWNSADAITFLKWIKKFCKVDPNELITPIEIRYWHLNNIDNCIKDNLASFEKLLWIQAKEDNTSDYLKTNFFANAREFEDAKDVIYNLLQLNNTVVLEENYETAIINYSKDNFNIDLKNVDHEDVMIDVNYKQLISNYTFGLNVDDMINILKEDNLEVFSLMHFDGYTNVVTEMCNQYQHKVTIQQEEEVSWDDDDDVLDIIETNIKSGEVKLTKLKNGKSSNGSHTSKINRLKAFNGKKAEEKVKKALVKKGYMVNHISNKTDGLHYDLEYKKQGETQWRKLEIKKDSGGFFFLSKHEKETALSNHLSSIYDVAIVNDKGVFIIKSLFNLEESTFENNNRFFAEPIEYKIHFKLEN